MIAAVSVASQPLFLRSVTIGLMLLAASVVRAQSPVDQGYQVRALALTGGDVVTEPGQRIERGIVLIRDGRMVAVGTDVIIPPDAERIAVDGHVVYAGFVDAGGDRLINPDLKLPTVEGRPVDRSRQALAGLVPDDHSGLTPQFLAADALKRGTADLDAWRQHGFATVQVTPLGRVSSGQSAIVQLSGLPPREAVISQGQFVTFKMWERRGNEYPSTLMGVHAHLRQTFLDANRAAQQQTLHDQEVAGIEPPPHDPVWQVFAAVQSHKHRALFEVETRDDIERALRYAAEQKLQPVLFGARDARLWVDRLKADNVDVILTLDYGDEPKADKLDAEAEFPKLAIADDVINWRKQLWKDRVGTAAALHAAGVRFAFSTHGLKSPAEMAQAVRRVIEAGLPRDAALAALTTNAAAIAGVGDDLGTIQPGRRANLVVLTGPFDHAQAKVRHMIVGGQRFEYHRDAKPVPAETPAETPAVDIAGTWQMTIESGGTPLPASLELVQVKNSLSGRFLSGQGDGAISSGKLTGAKLQFEVSIGAGARAVILKFTGDAEQNKLNGTVKSAFGPAAAWTAVREPQPAAKSPIELTAVETDDDDDAPGPVSALAPAAAASATAPRLLEFPEDRKARPLKTGGNVLIRGGTVITGTGVTLPNTSILVKNGQIVSLEPDLVVEESFPVIDATGRYVMPGIIDTHSHIMISNGLGGVNEATHSIVCEVRINDVINTLDPQEYRALAGGVTTIRLLHGSANVVGGQDAVVQLKHGATAAEHLFPGAHSGVKFALGENVKFRQTRFPNTRLGVEAVLTRGFVEALEYRRQWQEYDRQKQQAGDAADKLLPPRRDLRLEALAEIIAGDKFIHSHCYRSDEILMLLRVAAQHGIRIWSLQHVLEGYKVAPEIVAHGASCSTFADWWAYKVEAFDAIPHNAALLYEAGANVVIKSDNNELMRHLYQEAAKPVRYGNLPPDVALQLVTLNAARELGLEDRIGSIEVGKQADLAIFNGHPLDTFTRCELTLIAGEPYFIREQQPTAMSAEAVARSAKPAELKLPKPEDRLPLVDWSPVNGSRYALVGATLHPVASPVIERGTVTVENGRIVSVAPGESVPDGWPVVRLDGLHVYPGLIDAGTTVGLTEIGKVVETHDFAETGGFQPDLRAGVAINPDSELIPVARAGGITAALIRPTGGVITGQASVMQLGGWTAPEMVLVDAAGLVINWPGAHDRKESFEQLREWFRSARVYDAARTAAADAGGLDRLVDPRYEALRPYLNRQKRVLIEAHSRQHIAEALKFAELEKLDITITGGTDAWKLAKELKAADVPVIVGPVMRDPLDEFDPFDAPYANPGRLHEAGVRFCIRSDNAANSRNAPFEAGMAVAYGLPEEVGLRSVTLSAAEILGIADQTGSLKDGLRADLVILDGSPLQVTSQVKGVVIAGKPYRPTSRQTEFYDKYRRRLQETRTPGNGRVAAP
jgi:imidazolonepropionase-like amidohydrolase